MTPDTQMAHGNALTDTAQPSPCYDFHCHSRASDGTLTPTELLERAAAAGVQWLALTDHDTHAGLAEARTAAERLGIRLVNGAEWSLRWEKRELHVLGLNTDPSAPAMQALESAQRAAREKRARLIGEKLDRAAGISGSYASACELSGDVTPGRPWFARVLMAQGKARDMNHAFNRFLKQGQSAFVATPWATLEEGITAIRASGGVAVLAHPQHYELTRTKLRRLLADFCAAGGQAIEVAMPGLAPHQRQRLEECLRDFPLHASGGSDFHSPEQSWLTLGRLPPQPVGARPVWELFGDCLA